MATDARVSTRAKPPSKMPQAMRVGQLRSGGSARVVEFVVVASPEHGQGPPKGSRIMLDRARRSKEGADSADELSAAVAVEGFDEGARVFSDASGCAKEAADPRDAVRARLEAARCLVRVDASEGEYGPTKGPRRLVAVHRLRPLSYRALEGGKTGAKVQ